MGGEKSLVYLEKKALCVEGDKRAGRKQGTSVSWHSQSIIYGVKEGYSGGGFSVFCPAGASVVS